MRNEIIAVCLLILSMESQAQDASGNFSLPDPELLPSTTNIDLQNDEAVSSDSEHYGAKKRIHNTSEYQADLDICLNKTQSLSWMDHEAKYGRIICWEELMTVDGFDIATINCLKEHFLLQSQDRINMIFGAPELISATVQSRIRLLTDAVPIADTRTAGDEFNHSMRIRISNHDYRIGLTAEKDAGEKTWNKNGPDYLSVFVHYKPAGKAFELLVGDHHIQAGQGLVCGTRQFGNFLMDPGSVVNNRTMIRPHSSMSEAGFRRGAALKWSKNLFSMLCSFSRNKLDGTGSVIGFDQDSLLCFTPDISGYHRTPNEISKRNANSRTSGIIDLMLSFDKAELGMCALAWHDEIMDKGFLEEGSTKINIGGIGLHGRWKTNTGHLFGELALSSTMKLSWTAGMISNPDKRIMTSIHLGGSGGTFLTPFSSPIGFLDNERMFLKMAATTKTITKTEATPYLVIRKKHSKEMNDLQVKPYTESGICITFKPDKKSKVVMMLRSTENWGRDSEDSGKSISEYIRISSIRFQTEHRPVLGIDLSSRVEFRRSNSREPKSAAFMASQDVDLDIKTLPCKIGMRITCFNVPDYEMAIRMSEADLPGNFRQSISYGKGYSWYFIAQPRIKGPIGIWMKISGTTCYDRWLTDPLESSISRSRMEISMQIRYQLKKG